MSPYELRLFAVFALACIMIVPFIIGVLTVHREINRAQKEDSPYAISGSMITGYVMIASSVTVILCSIYVLEGM